MNTWYAIERLTHDHQEELRNERRMASAAKQNAPETPSALVRVRGVASNLRGFLGLPALRSEATAFGRHDAGCEA